VQNEAINLPVLVLEVLFFAICLHYVCQIPIALKGHLLVLYKSFYSLPCCLSLPQRISIVLCKSWLFIPS